MMDVMLLAFLVMLVKLSGLVEFHVGPAVVAFSVCCHEYDRIDEF
jgi:paraquat-inducible protein A